MLDKNIEPGGFWRALAARCEPDVVARYRELKRLASEAHNHELEQDYFRGELRAQRSAYLRPWQIRFWWSVLYDALSNFGRSTLRPFLLWLLSIPAFATVYLALAERPCADEIGRALYLAFNNAVVIGSNRQAELGQAYACLYGGSGAEPRIPTFAATLGLLHALFAAALIFLFLLALRNLFKIK